MVDIPKKRLDHAVRNLAPFSSALQRLIEIANQPNYERDEIVEVVEQDASLTIRVLGIANSSVIAPIARVESVEHAITLVGLEVVTTAAVAESAKWMQQSLPGYGSEARTFENGLKTAVAAKLIAKRAGLSDLASIAFTGGLLHDIGKVVLSEFMQSGLACEIEGSVSTTSLDWRTGEREAMGVDHCDVGAMIADQFGLGARLRAVIEHHHNPANADKEHRTLVGIVHSADAVRAMMGGDASIDALAYPMDEQVLKSLGIRPRDLAELFCEALIESNELLKVV